MADDRAAQITRIQQIERIHALEASQSKSKAPVDKDWVDEASDMAGKAKDAILSSHATPAPLAIAMNPMVQKAIGKVLDYPAGFTRTLAAKLAGMITPGENPIGMDDFAKAAMGSAPGVGDQAEKFGLPSVHIPIPGETHPHLETNDIVNAVGNTALNPLMYGVAQKYGRKLYNNAIEPIETEGERFNKTDVGDELYKHKIWNPLNLNKKLQPIVDDAMKQIGVIEQKATAAGAKVDIKEAMQLAQNKVNDIKRLARPGSPEMKLADKMQASIDNHMQAQAQAPEDILRELPYTKMEDGKLAPKTTTVLDQSEGKSGPTPIESSQWKTDAYKSAKDNAFDSLRRSETLQNFKKLQGAGLKNETENAIGKTLGPMTKEEYKNLNEGVGKILSTGKAQRRVSNQAGREFNSVTSPFPNGTESLSTALSLGASGGDMEGAGLAYALHKAMKGLKLSQMPVGYLLRSMPQADLNAGIIGSQLNPWTQQGEDDGKR